MKHPLVWLAIVLVIGWVIARVVLAITSAFLHLLWIAAVIAILIWLVRRLA